MKIIAVIRQKIYSFFHPTILDMLCQLGIIDNSLASPEDIEKIYALIESYDKMHELEMRNKENQDNKDNQSTSDSQI